MSRSPLAAIVNRRRCGRAFGAGGGDSARSARGRGLAAPCSSDSTTTNQTASAAPARATIANAAANSLPMPALGRRLGLRYSLALLLGLGVEALRGDLAHGAVPELYLEEEIVAEAGDRVDRDQG